MRIPGATKGFLLSAFVAVTVLGCGDDTTGTAGQFVAFNESFRPYTTWTRTEVATAEQSLAGHPPGRRVIFANNPPPPAGGEYPVGTIILKVIETSDVQAEWDLFAMVKRGGGYNSNGAVGWEYFRLGLSTQGIPVIVGRGLNPNEGHSYGGGGATTQLQGCNGCHGAVAAEYDHILAPELRPGASQR